LRFEELPDCCIPKSQAVCGGNFDSVRKIDEQLIATVVARWRGTAMSSKPAPAPTAPDLKFRSSEAVRWSAPSFQD